jgi:hypothetical protein
MRRPQGAIPIRAKANSCGGEEIRAVSSWETVLPNTSLQLTRLAGENVRLPGPPGYAIMGRAMPEPPGS